MAGIGFLFPGQGAQYVGMGKELYESNEIVREVFDEAEDILKQDLLNLCFNGPDEELMKTENTQPAILTLSIAITKVLFNSGIKPLAAAGLSLGEYSALAAAGSIAFSDVLPLIKKRGMFMQEAVPVGMGAMAAIMALDNEKVVKCCKDASDIGTVEVANYNCPGQIVISGLTEAVKKACILCKEAGAKRTVMLQVSGPFHSSLMKPAGDRLKAELEKINISDPQIPVISNVTALPVNSGSEVKDLLVRQVSNSVRWEESMRWMLNNGIDNFIEIGPGKVLSGFIRKITGDVKVLNIEDCRSLEAALMV